MFVSEQYADAIGYLESAQNGLEDLDEELLLTLARCYTQQKYLAAAIGALEQVLASNSESIDARVQLAEIYEEKGDNRSAFEHISEVIRLRKYAATIQPSPYHKGRLKTAKKPRTLTKAQKVPAISKEETQELARQRDSHIRATHQTLKIVEETMQHGIEGATNAWLEAAIVLIADFRNNRVFYPPDKFIKFLGYSTEARRARYAKKAEQDEYLERMMDRLGEEDGKPEEYSSCYHTSAEKTGARSREW